MAAAETAERFCLQARRATKQGNWTKAKRYYLQALERNPDLPNVHYALAVTCYHLGDLPAAAHHFREVTRLDPLRVEAFINLGAVLKLLREYRDAIAALQQAIRIDPQHPDAHYNLGLVHRCNGQADLASQAYRKALCLDPCMPDAHLNLANILLERKNFGQALAHYKQALRFQPNWKKAVDGLALALTALNRPRSASVR
jgi:tetratricopeptide (TPR) repeat protein